MLCFVLPSEGFEYKSFVCVLFMKKKYLVLDQDLIGKSGGFSTLRVRSVRFDLFICVIDLMMCGNKDYKQTR